MTTAASHEPVPHEDVEASACAGSASMKWMASRPGHERRDHARRRAAPMATSTPASPVRSLRASKTIAPAVMGVAMRNAKRAADGRSSPAKRPAEIEMPDRLMPGMRARAWAAPMPSGDREASRRRRVLRPATDLVRDPQDHAADDEHHRDEADAGGPAVSKKSPNRKPTMAAGTVAATSSQASLRSGSSTERAVADRRQTGRDEPQPVRTEVDEQRDERAQVEHHAERQRRDERVVPAEQPGHDDEVARLTRPAGTR